MAYNQYGDSQSLGKLHQYVGRFSHLRNASRSGGNFLPVHSLDGVDNSHRRHMSSDNLLHCIQAGLTQKKQIVGKFSDPIGPDLDLLQGLLSRYIEKMMSVRRHMPAHLQKKS